MIFFSILFRLPDDINNQRSPAAPIAGPPHDHGQKHVLATPPPTGPEPPILGPNGLHLARGLRTQDGR